VAGPGREPSPQLTPHPPGAGCELLGPATAAPGKQRRQKDVTNRTISDCLQDGTLHWIIKRHTTGVTLRHKTCRLEQLQQPGSSPSCESPRGRSAHPPPSEPLETNHQRAATPPPPIPHATQQLLTSYEMLGSPSPNTKLKTASTNVRPSPESTRSLQEPAHITEVSGKNSSSSSSSCQQLQP
jgi:hypothetical protein